jgi:hypothetical protein
MPTADLARSVGTTAAVRDDDSGLRQLGRFALDVRLGCRVQVARRLVQQRDPRR